MRLKSLKTEGFRNLKSSQLEFSRGVNLVLGNNGAGKTSLLESIYYSVHGKSFKSGKSQAIVSNQRDNFLIRAKYDSLNADASKSLSLGVTFSGQGRKLSVNEQAQRTFSSVVSKVPMLYIGADSHFAWQASSKQRRSHLDWGVFHVEHCFLAAWREYNSMLAQYNSALKSRLPENQLEGWRERLAFTGEKVSELRFEHICRINSQFSTLARDLGGLEGVTLDYNPGWNSSHPLFDCLLQTIERDRVIGHCSVGPHRCDVNFAQSNRVVKDELSQGQMKLLLYALKLAQADVLQDEATNNHLIYLVDDMPSELDASKQQKIMDLCCAGGNQVFVTAINKMIHVKHNATQFRIDEGLVSWLA
jgi:DNA replication and repair protein RecF